jgi:hypothetical protein
MASARTCRRCGAPVPEPPQDAPVPWPAAQGAVKPSMAPLAWIGIVLLNLIALYYLILSVVVGIIEGTPAQWGANYLAPWACAAIGFTAATVPTCTVVLAVRRRGRRHERHGSWPVARPHSYAPPMNGDEVPVPERPSRRWPHWLLSWPAWPLASGPSTWPSGLGPALTACGGALTMAGSSFLAWGRLPCQQAWQSGNVSGATSPSSAGGFSGSQQPWASWPSGSSRSLSLTCR